MQQWSQMSECNVRQAIKHLTHLSLTRFESVKQMRDGTNVIVLRKQNELAIYEVRVVYSLTLAIVQECVLLDAGEPPLPGLDLAFAECHFD